MQPVRKFVVNGVDRTREWNALFISLEIEDEAGLSSDSLTVTLADDGRIAWPKKESEIQVWTGWQKPNEPPALEYRGLYVTSDVSLGFPGNTLTITADGARIRSGFTAPTDRTWENITLGDIASTLAKKHGFTLAITPRLAGIALDYIDQKGQSDADLLTRLAEQHGGTLKPVGDKLVLFDKGDGRNVSGQDTDPEPLPMTALVRGTVTLSGRTYYQSVAAHYRIDGNAGSGTLATGDEQPQKVMSYTYADRDTAAAAVKAEQLRLQRGNYVLTITSMPGNPRLRAEGLIEISGALRPEVNGLWVIKTLTEIQDTDTYTMRLTAGYPKQRVAAIPNPAPVTAAAS